METVSNLFGQLLPILVTLCIPAILILVKYISDKIAKSLNIKDTQIINEFILSIVTQAIAYAEQCAHKLAEEKVLTGNEKLQLAINFVKHELEKSGLVDVTAQEIADKIEAMLGMDKLGGEQPTEENNEDSM